MRNLLQSGWSLIRAKGDEPALSALRSSAFVDGQAGQRCLLDHPLVRQAAISLRNELEAHGFLSPTAAAIQAIAFDKIPEANWKVAWHQDLMFPFAQAVRSPGFDRPSVKDGVNYARPPRTVLEQLLAVRLHLDDCTLDNGPLRVITGSHLYGVIPSSEIASAVKRGPADTCLASKGDALLMRPLLLHASSSAKSPSHRRVLHFVYHDGPAMVERWHRSI